MKIALAGNPNSGKTTTFNALTGKNEKVGNWAGVTVDKKVSTIKKSYYDGDEEIIAVDLPGTYSMSPFTSDESVTSTYIKNENPDVIINVVDATNLSRSLFFTTQLLELGIPVVIALNKTDINEKNQTYINTLSLSKALNCPVFETVSTSADGLKAVVESAVAICGRGQIAPYLQGNTEISDKKSALEADKKRFRFVNGVVKTVEKRKRFSREKDFGDKIDAVLTNKWVGIPGFAVIMFSVFWISQAGPGRMIADMLTALLEKGQNYIATFFIDANPLISALLVDGIIGGVIAVIGFLPLVMVMYFLIALLEDCGYMARASVVLDPIFKKVGLSGKSVIPFVIGTGCAIPGIMACRTIHDERERRATAMITPFMPCGAKLPVIALFAGAFFKDASWVGPLMYFVGIFLIFISALIINKITGHRVRKSYFIIELPQYKIPSLSRAVKSMCSRGKEYVVKAATVILLCNTAIQIMQTFTWNFTTAQSADTSILASVAKPFAYVLLPVIGVLSWQFAAATITGFIAKENVVGTLAVCFAGLNNLIDSDSLSLAEGAGTETAGILAISKAAALAFLMFNLYAPPCVAALAAMSSEMKSKKWFFGGIAFQLSMGFTVSYIVYTVGTLITSPSALNVKYALWGLAAILIFAFVIVMLSKRANGKTETQYKLKSKQRK